MRTITLETARRLALVRQRLAGERPTGDAAGILQVVRDLGCVQLDPISVVARSHTLVLWSRIGRYDFAHLDQLLWQDRSLFEYWAHAASIVPTDDYAIHRRLMHTYATEPPTTHVGARFHAWLKENAGLRRHILGELKRNGPLPARAFEDQAEAEWYSTGWTSGRNVSQMLDYLWTKGLIMVAGRSGIQKLWDLSERCLPTGTPRETLSQREVVYRAAQRSLRALGVATTKHITQHFIRGRYAGLPQVMKQLERDGRIERIAVEGGAGEWFIHADDVPLLDQLGAIDFARTTLLSPFDNLICDRARTRQLFDFDFTIEIYVPPHKRRYGYYVLPILHGDRLIGRVDPKMDREHGRLMVNAVHAEAAAPMNRTTARAIRGAIEELATFLGAAEIVFGRRLPEGWQRDLR
jgi:uncharacterized protein YcaQ